MDHSDILRRAWRILRIYKALWVFGFLTVLTTCSGGGGGGGGNGGQGGANGSSWLPDSPGIARSVSWDRALVISRLPDLLGDPGGWAAHGVLGSGNAQAQAIDWLAVGLVVAGVLGLVVVAALVAAVIHYVSTTALIRMVDLHEQDGRRRSVREGFHLGWSLEAWRIFLADVLVILPLVLIFLGMFALALTPLLLLLAGEEGLSVFGVVLSIALSLSLIGLAVLAALGVSIWQPLYRRACIVEDLGTVDGLRRGFRLLWRRLWDAGLMWMVLLLLAIAFGLLLVLGFFLLLPLMLGLGLAAAALLAVPALLVGGGAMLAFGSIWPAIVVGVLALLAAFTMAFLPLTFLAGLFEVFHSSAWTLTYREMLPTPAS